jgi:SAM-dependent methyltransferase
MPSSVPLRPVLLLLVVGLVGGLSPATAPAQDLDSSDTSLVETTAPDTTVDPDVPFVRTPQNLVDRMLQLADVDQEDVVYDLGSGDGRIPITAAQMYGARGVGIEIQPDLVREARQNAEQAGVADLVEFQQGDLFEADISGATVVTLYLLPDVNDRLRPKLLRQLEPGTRVVSHGFDMDGWEPDDVVETQDTFLFLWTVPETLPPDLRED